MTSSSTDDVLARTITHLENAHALACLAAGSELLSPWANIAMSIYLASARVSVHMPGFPLAVDHADCVTPLQAAQAELTRLPADHGRPLDAAARPAGLTGRVCAHAASGSRRTHRARPGIGRCRQSSGRPRDVRPFQVGVSEGERVAKGGLDREAEEIADPSGVTTAGVDLLEDAVFTQSLGSEICFFPGELATDRHEARGCLPADEKVLVDAAGPCPAAMVEPRSEPDADGTGQRDVPAVQGESAVDDVGQGKGSELSACQGMKGDQGDGQRDRGVGRVQGPADRLGIQRQRHGGVHRCGPHGRGLGW